MKTTLMSLFALAILCSCDPNQQACTPQTMQAEDKDGTQTTTAACPTNPSDGGGTVDVPVDTSPVESEVPAVASLFSAQVKFSNFDAADMDKVQAALELIQQVVRSKDFRSRVLNHTYNGVKQFANNNGLTNEQIYLKLLDGAEELLPDANHRMDLSLELYTNNSTSTVGYTNPNTLTIWMNTKFFDKYVPAEVARNVFHEWTHKLGFDHDSSSTAKRPYSVPYGVGSIIEDLAFTL